MIHEKLHRIVVHIPEWAFDEIKHVAWDREWSISHVVRYLVCGSVEAWEREAYEVSKDSE